MFWFTFSLVNFMSWIGTYFYFLTACDLFFILFLLLYSVIHLTFSLFFFAACDRQWIIGVKNSAPERGHWGRHCPGFTTGNKQSPIIPQGPIKSPTERKRYPTFQVRHIFIFPFPFFFSQLCPWLRFDFFCEIMKVGNF